MPAPGASARHARLPVAQWQQFHVSPLVLAQVKSDPLRIGGLPLTHDEVDEILHAWIYDEEVGRFRVADAALRLG